MLNIQEIYKIAEDAHAGQIRKMGEDKGKPYIIHPQRVAAKFDDITLKSIAILHDVIEDTSLTMQSLFHMGIDIVVCQAVQVLTRKKSETYLDFILRIKTNDFALPVKIEDIKDNMRSLEEGSRKDKYLLALYILMTK